MTSLPRAEDILRRALEARAFSAVTAEVGRSSGPVWRFAGGRLGFEPDAALADNDTIFDLASISKVIATTTIALELVSRRELDLDAPVRAFLPAWQGQDRAEVTVRDLLEHCSGLPAHRHYSRTLRGREAFMRAISVEPLEYPPRTRALYSDLGFILVGVLLETVGDGTLAAQFSRWRSAIELTEPLDFQPPQSWHPRTAKTEHYETRGLTLQGEVHDLNTAALGGVAGHAGLFGTARAVGAAARWWLELLLGNDDGATGVTADAARRFARRSSVPGSSRALGWDTMLPTSSCGTRMTVAAIGHTGFTGTSLWLDSGHDVYCVLLTNRVLASNTSDEIQQVRRAFHDAVGETLWC
jgi:CubicO group peptidase (beta-lactamase class C family)